MIVKFGKCDLELGGKYIDADLRDSNDILHDVPALHQRFADDGFLFIRGLIDRDTVIRARRTILDEMVKQGGIKTGTDPMEAIVQPDSRVPGLMGRKPITHHPDVRAVLEAKELFDFHSRYFGKEVLTYDYKWLRAVRAPENTAAHYDVVYMGRGAVANLRTNWIPFSDISMELGPLALCVGSHKLPGFDRLRETYGKSDVDKVPTSGHLSNDPMEIIDKFGGKWQTSQFRMGDVLIFGMHTMHSSLNNCTDRYRISADVRFQPADEPVDERWIGENPKAHYVWSNTPEEKKVPIAALRKEWGV